jgi:pSer/pThr/pTyr-binding forkhead associated (FHA) protein
VGRFDPATGVRPEVDLWYEDDKRSVSRRHAIIVRKDNRFYVAEEIGALNGTFVNGEKVGSKGLGKEMKHGDHVNFGMLSFQFELLQED